jgi:peptidoglycan/xylan/chitin deacetylase (PgdA/CDA1 family)
MYWLIIILVVVVASTLLFWASANIGSNVYLKSICCAKTQRRVVALTFDDAPNAQTTPQVLDVLKQYNVKAMFCLIGQEAERNPELVRRIIDEGHIVANHTYNHSASFTFATSKSVAEQLQRCNDAIYALIGRKPRIFRPPFGVTNPIIGKVVRKMKLTTVGWTIRSLDTIYGDKIESMCKRVVRRLHPGAVVLLHDRCTNADKAVALLIERIIEQGYEIVPLQEMLNLEVYAD